jgi:predicted RNase H-like HicB family nuclease
VAKISLPQRLEGTKKTLRRSMKKDFNVIIEKDEDGFYIASVPALKGCHTQAKSLDILMERIEEVIELCLEEKEAF